MTNCKTCKLVAQRDAGVAPLWDNIHRTAHWDVVHSYNTSLLGWLVLVTRTHRDSIDGLTEEEALELGGLIRAVSIALKQLTGCVKTYVMQFAEHPSHPHVHFHVVPRMAEQPDERRGARIFCYLGVPEEERVSEEAMNEFARAVRRVLGVGE